MPTHNSGRQRTRNFSGKCHVTSHNRNRNRGTIQPSHWLAHAHGDVSVISEHGSVTWTSQFLPRRVPRLGLLPSRSQATSASNVHTLAHPGSPDNVSPPNSQDACSTTSFVALRGEVGCRSEVTIVKDGDYNKLIGPRTAVNSVITSSSSY